MGRTAKLQATILAKQSALGAAKGKEYQRTKRVDYGEIKRIPQGTATSADRYGRMKGPATKVRKPDTDKREPEIDRGLSLTYRADVRHNRRERHNGKSQIHSRDC